MVKKRATIDVSANGNGFNYQITLFYWTNLIDAFLNEMQNLLKLASQIHSVTK